MEMQLYTGLHMGGGGQRSPLCRVLPFFGIYKLGCKHTNMDCCPPMVSLLPPKGFIVAPQRFQYSNFCPILKPWLYSGVRETGDQHNLVLSAVPWEHPVATPSFLVAPPWRAPPFFVHGGPVPTLSPVVRSQGAFMLRAHQTLRQTSQMSSCHWRISSQRVRRRQTGYVAAHGGSEQYSN